MAKYDLEDICDDVLALMTDTGAAGLNARIAALDAEKTAKGKTLSTALAIIAAGSYHFQSWSAKILNSNPAIWYGVESVTTVDGGAPGAVLKTNKIFVEIVMVDDGMTNDVSKRIMRYTRILEELFSEAFKIGEQNGSIKIETVQPSSFKLDYDSSEEIKIGGVSLTVTLA